MQTGTGQQEGSENYSRGVSVIVCVFVSWDGRSFGYREKKNYAWLAGELKKVIRSLSDQLSVSLFFSFE